MGQLLRQALAMTRLRSALDRVLANNGQPGVDGVSCLHFAAHAGLALPELQGDVLAGRYRPQPLKRLWLPRPDKAPRPIAVPTVRDRVLQTAVAQALMPLLEAEFEECSYAYRQGRSVRMAVERIGLLQRQGYDWVVEADIERFFDRIPHARLLALVQGLCNDAEMVALIEQWLTAPVQDLAAPGGALAPLVPNPLGVPQGSPISPALANLYLDHLDEALLDADHALVRYADDFVVLAKSRRRAEEAVALSAEVLHDLALKLNPLKTRVVSFEQGFKFLGWHFVRSLAVPARKVAEQASAEVRAPAVFVSRAVKPDGRVLTSALSPASSAVSGSGGVAASPAAVPDDGLQGEMSTAWAEALAAQPGWQAAARTALDGAARVPPTPALSAASADNGERSGPATLFDEGDESDDLAQALDLDAMTAAAEAGEGVAPLVLEDAPGAAAPTLAKPLAALDDADQPEAPEPPQVDDEAPTLAAPLPSLQRTLYLVDAAASLHTENRRLVVQREGEEVLALPAVNVDQVMLFGRNAVTTAAMVVCLQHGIPLAILSRTGRFYGRLEPPGGEAVLLQQAQFAAQAVPDLNLAMARHFVLGKIGNAVLTLNRYARHRKGLEGAAQIQTALARMRDLQGRLKTAPDLDTVRGLEGAAAAAYFGAWRLWLAPTWTFGARVQQAGADPINALLDLGYTLLRHAVAGLIQARGLNPWLGHLHAVKSGHMALASDLMEEFRAVTVDTVVLNLCLNGGLQPADFTERAGAYTLKPTPAKRFIREFELRLNTERQPPAGAELIDPRRLIDAQVRRLAAVYRQADPALYRPSLFR